MLSFTSKNGKHAYFNLYGKRLDTFKNEVIPTIWGFGFYKIIIKLILWPLVSAQINEGMFT